VLQRYRRFRHVGSPDDDLIERRIHAGTIDMPSRCDGNSVPKNFLDRHRHEIELMRRNDGDVAMRRARHGDESFT
jgi:hypothetical protein